MNGKEKKIILEAKEFLSCEMEKIERELEELERRNII